MFLRKTLDENVTYFISPYNLSPTNRIQEGNMSTDQCRVLSRPGQCPGDNLLQVAAALFGQPANIWRLNINIYEHHNLHLFENSTCESTSLLTFPSCSQNWAKYPNIRPTLHNSDMLHYSSLNYNMLTISCPEITFLHNVISAKCKYVSSIFFFLILTLFLTKHPLICIELPHSGYYTFQNEISISFVPKSFVQRSSKLKTIMQYVPMWLESNALKSIFQPISIKIFILFTNTNFSASKRHCVHTDKDTSILLSALTSYQRWFIPVYQ